MPTPTHSSKLSAVSVTALTDKYRENPYWRSAFNIIAIQTLLVIFTVVVFAFAIKYQQTQTVQVLRDHITQIASGAPPINGALANAFQNVRYETLGGVLLVLITLTVLFGFLAARYALSPTRNSLEYQKRFIGNIAHELRTPLSIIRTNTEVALMDPSLNDYARSTLTMTIEELDRVSETINNLLTFDTLLRPERIRKGPVNLMSVIELVVERHRDLATTRGIMLTHSGSDIAYLFGNEVALGQVFTNLVKNALNYTPQHEGRSVEVRIVDNDETITASVIDTGIGIAQKDLYHVFEPFYRGDTSRARRIGGGTSGLGLAIVNDIVRAHQGSIIVRSALNRGTTIEISFPKADTTEYVKEIAAKEDDAEEYEAAVVKS
ncbi:MAG: HAMP domain-containing sensor histidine kinase [Patescibacteria group bacterium]